jgi:uncharacterized membrane protein YhaH (DUF805 family)
LSSPYSPYPQRDDQSSYGQGPQGSWRPSEYLQGAPVDFGTAITEAFKHMFVFKGRASRSAFWWFILFAGIIDVVISIISRAGHVIALAYVIEVVIAIVTIGLQVRRLHDSGRTGWWWWIGIIPLIGGIVLLVFDCMPSTPGPNKYN